MRGLAVLLAARAASADPDTTVHIDDDLADAGPSAGWHAPLPAATALDTAALIDGRFAMDTVQTAPPRVSDRMFGLGFDTN